VASRLTPEQRQQYRRLARDGEAGAWAQEARRRLLEDGQSFTIFEHKAVNTQRAKARTKGK
jgi:chromosome condensin MukBEF MukE localization factor